MGRLEIRLLGSFQVTLGGVSLTGFESDKARALLAYLAVEVDRPHRREILAGLLWPDTPERKARTNLRSALANLRQVIQDHTAQPPFLNITRQTLQFNPEGDAWVDVAAFSQAVISESHEEMQAAVDLYRGGFLAGFYLSDAPLFEEWALITRESTQRQVVRTLHRLTPYYQETGSHELALQFAQRQVELEPFQEAAHQQVMWSLALSGQRNAALLHYERFKTTLAKELGVEPLDETQEMYARILEGELPESPTPDMILRRLPRAVGDCPYQGLAPFREAQAQFYFGREGFIQELVKTIRHPAGAKTAAIVGPSGSGKSSVVFAGLFPALRDEGDWLMLETRPGSQPVQALVGVLINHLQPRLGVEVRRSQILELEQALLAGETSLDELGREILGKMTKPRNLLLVVDQLEEIYTQCPDPNLRHRFLDILLERGASTLEESRSLIRLVITMRGDFVGQALSYRPLADALNQGMLLLGPMNQGEMLSAIEKPAEISGAAFEPGLATRILNDIGEELGNLPLLEFALTLLWNRLDQGWLTHEAYEEIGGVGGSLARYAEEVYHQLDEPQREIARGVLIQLVQPGRGTEDTRRLGKRSEFGDDAWDLIRRLADKRLVVTGGDDRGGETVEIIHEALIREWRRLGGWMNTDRAFRLWQEDLRRALQQWEDSRQDKGALLRGVPLVNAETWLLEREIDLSKPEREFIKASIVEREARRAVEKARQERERKLEQRTRRFLQALVIVLLIAASVSIGFGWVARREARASIEAYSLSLSANAQQALSDHDTTTALVLALAANQIENPPLTSQRTLLEVAYSPGPRRVYWVEEIFPGVGGPPTSLAINPDPGAGTTALTGFVSGDIILWDYTTGAEIRRFHGHRSGAYDPTQIVAYTGVNAIAFHPNGRMALSGGEDGTVILWDLESGEEIRRLEGHSGPVRAVATSPDGLTAVTGGASSGSLIAPGELILWDLGTGEEIRRFEGHPEAVVAIALSPDGGKMVASSGEVNYAAETSQVYSLILWDLSSGKMLYNFEDIDRDQPAVAFTPDGRLALAASTDHNLYLWDLETGARMSSFEGHDDIVKTLAISPDGRSAISGGGDGQVFLWDLVEGEVSFRSGAHTSGVMEIAFSPDGRSALSAGSDGTVILWDLDNAALRERFIGHQAPVLDAAYLPDGVHILSASGINDPASPLVEEEGLRLWNLGTGEQSGALDWGLADIFQFDISPDGRRAFSGHMTEANMRLWDLATGREIRRFEGHMGPVFSAAFTPDGLYGFSGGSIDSAIILWDLQSGGEVRRFMGHEGVIWALAVSPDGTTVLSGSDDRLVILWDLATGERIHQMAGHGETVSGVAYSPDGTRALSGDTQGPIIEWNLDTGEEIQRFSGHSGTGYIGRTRVAYLPDGQTAISSGWDGTVALWDLESGRELHRFRGHQADFIFDIAVSPDGSRALSCATDQMVIEWDLDLPTLDELLEWIDANRFIRDLTCSERELYQIEPLCTP